MESLISIVIPVYNGSATIVRTLDCIKNQIYKNLEIIIINDGSKDSSQEVIEEYIKSSSMNIKLYNQKNTGLSQARNNGFSYSMGEYISFVDCDDTIPKDFYSEMTKFDTDIVICDILYKYPNKDSLSNQNFFNKDKLLKGQKEFDNCYKILNPMASNKLFKRKVLENILFDKGVIFEDVLFFFKALVHVDSISFASTHYGYFIYEESLSNAVDVRYDHLYSNWNLIVKYHKKHGTFEQFEEALLYSSSRYLKDIYMRKMKNIVNYKELSSRYYKSLDFLKSTFNAKYHMPYFSLKELYLKSITIINVWILWTISNKRVILSKLKKNVCYKLFSKSKYYKTLDKINYQNILVNDIDFSHKLSKPYFCKNYENYFYGIVRGFDEYDLNATYLEHGYNFSSIVTENTTQLLADKIVCCTSRRAEVLRKRYGKEVEVVGPYIKRTESFYNPEQIANMKKEYGKVLLVFPSHSSFKYNSRYNYETFKSRIEEVKKSKIIDTVFVCLHYYDVLNDVAKYYDEYNVVCAGHIYDIYNLSKLRSIIELSDYTMSNEIGSHVAYCFALNKPHLLAKSDICYNGEFADMDSKRFKTYKEHEIELVNEIFDNDFVEYNNKKQEINKYFEIEGTYEV